MELFPDASEQNGALFTRSLCRCLSTSIRTDLSKILVTPNASSYQKRLDEFSIDLRAGIPLGRKLDKKKKTKVNAERRRLLGAFRIIVCTNVMAHECPDGSCAVFWSKVLATTFIE